MRPTGSDPRGLRAAVIHGLVTIVAALVVLIGGAVSSGGLRSALLLLAPALMLAGGLAAGVRAYSRWRAGGNWFVWQGALWFLLCLALVTFLGVGRIVFGA